MFDLMGVNPSNDLKVLDKGHVRLIDVMPRLVEEGQTADSAIVQAARVSYGAGTKSVSEDETLIRYLMRHQHSSPLEQVEFKFHMKLPLFCARQIQTHRQVSRNEISGRYSVMTDDYYIPDPLDLRNQSNLNKQGGDRQMDPVTAISARDSINTQCELAHQEYKELLELGLSREQARIILPLNLYTEWYWKIDLRNLVHFLGLRCDSHAQWETREFAEAVLSLIKNLVPFTVKAWEDYSPMRDAITLTGPEVKALRQCNIGGPNLYVSTNKREQEEWEAKAKLLFEY